MSTAWQSVWIAIFRCNLLWGIWNEMFELPRELQKTSKIDISFLSRRHQNYYTKIAFFGHTPHIFTNYRDFMGLLWSSAIQLSKWLAFISYGNQIFKINEVKWRRTSIWSFNFIFSRWLFSLWLDIRSSNSTAIYFENCRQMSSTWECK